MGAGTSIEWCTHTFNGWIGCTAVSPACANCYAEAYGNRFGVAWGRGKPRRRTSPANWKHPLAWNRAAAKAGGPAPRVFCSSLADWLDDEVPAGWLADLLGLVHETQRLRWLLLSKRPELWRARLEAALAALEDGTSAPRGPDAAVATANMVRAWLAGDAPTHVWVGTTVEDQRRADERIPALLRIPAAVRFLSCEPLLESVDLGLNSATCLCCKRPWASRWVRLRRPIGPDLPHLVGDRDHVADVGVYRARSNPHGALSVETPGGSLGVKPGEFECLGGLDWIIAGGESGPDARPMHPAWAGSLRDQARVAGVPFLFKQWGEWQAGSGPPDRRDRDRIMLSDGRLLGLNDDLGAWNGPEWNALQPNVVSRVGKAAAGRELYGRTWDELPEVARG